MVSLFEKLWGYIEIPVYLLVVWNIITVLIQVYASGIMSTLKFISPIVSVAVFSYIGFFVVKAKNPIGFAAKAGAYAGIITGLIGAILGIILFYAMPGLYSQAISDAVAAGAPEDTVRTFMQIGIYVSLVISPMITALIGAAISAISGWITSKN